MKMRKNPDLLVGKPYNEENYNCYHFVAECLVMPSIDEIAVSHAKQQISDNLPHYEQLPAPIDYCLVLLGNKHIGTYYKGYIYHNDVHMVKADSLRVIQRKYAKIAYYDKKDTPSLL